MKFCCPYLQTPISVYKITPLIATEPTLPNCEVPANLLVASYYVSVITWAMHGVPPRLLFDWMLDNLGTMNHDSQIWVPSVHKSGMWDWLLCRYVGLIIMQIYWADYYAYMWGWLLCRYVGLIIMQICGADSNAYIHSYAGPKAWNDLPFALQELTDTCTFKRQLKTHLFTLAYTNCRT